MYKRTSRLVKKYEDAFILEPQRLVKIVEVIRSYYGVLAYDVDFLYQLEMNSGSSDTYNRLDNVFEHDNKRSDSIRILEIHTFRRGKDITPDDNKIKDFIEIYGSDAPLSRSLCSLVFDADNTLILNASVTLSINDSNDRTARQLQSELDDQIERTLLKDIDYRFATGRAFGIFPYPLVAIVLLMIILAASFEGLFSRTPSMSKQQALDLLQMAQISSSEAQKIEFLFAVQKAQLESIMDGVSWQPSLWNVLTGFVIIALMATALYICFALYSKGIFMWGDYAQHYSRIKGRREFLWKTIVIGIPLAIAVNLYTNLL